MTEDTGDVVGSTCWVDEVGIVNDVLSVAGVDEIVSTVVVMRAVVVGMEEVTGAELVPGGGMTEDTGDEVGTIC